MSKVKRKRRRPPKRKTFKPKVQDDPSRIPAHTRAPHAQQLIRHSDRIKYWLKKYLDEKQPTELSAHKFQIWLHGESRSRSGEYRTAANVLRRSDHDTIDMMLQDARAGKI